MIIIDIWKLYESRFHSFDSQIGSVRRSIALDRARNRLSNKLPHSLSYTDMLIGDILQQVAVVDTTDFDTKKIFSMPGEDIPHGSVVEWSNAVWIVTEVDAHNEVYTSGKMRQCNYLLKWIDGNGNLISKWSIVEDGTKYLIGERAEPVMAIGDARIAITLGKDRDTSLLNRGKRFLVDDLDSNDVLAYQITKPNKLFNVYNGRGVFRFILKEVNLTDNDNVELRIADYYNWKPKTPASTPDVKKDITLEEIVSNSIEKEEIKVDTIADRKVWL